MDRINVQFKMLSLNVRGVRTLEKRKAIFNWLEKQKADICFIQERHSTVKVENQWKKQWHGNILFSHGFGHSCGVAVSTRSQVFRF